MMNANDRFSEFHEPEVASSEEESELAMIPKQLSGQHEADVPKSLVFRQKNDTQTGDTSAKAILVVEDDDAIGEFIMLALSLETSHHVVLAKDSTQALALARNNTWDLFILDYLLHEMNGITLFDLLHTIEGLKSTPALILSAANVPQADIAQRNLYSLMKPLDLDDFLSTISTILLRHSQNELSDTPA
jgi:CheY-like chemotaxis protein